MIFKPSLPPKVGYTEVIDERGNHVYKPTAATLAVQKNARQEMIATNAVLSNGCIHLSLPMTADNASLIRFTAPRRFY